MNSQAVLGVFRIGDYEVDVLISGPILCIPIVFGVNDVATGCNVSVNIGDFRIGVNSSVFVLVVGVNGGNNVATGCVVSDNFGDFLTGCEVSDNIGDFLISGLVFAAVDGVVIDAVDGAKTRPLIRKSPILSETSQPVRKHQNCLRRHNQWQHYYHHQRVFGVFVVGVVGVGVGVVVGVDGVSVE